MTMFEKISFSIPVAPLPLSACFNNVPGLGRVPSKKYRVWRRNVDMHIKFVEGRRVEQ